MAEDRNDADQNDELDQVRDESVERLKRGQLPVEAERRLRALRGRSDFFTSDLTVAEVALGVDRQITPISQVMGSCVYHVGLPYGYVWAQPSAGLIQRVPVLAQAWNEARDTALARLREEAVQCGADAVVGVHIARSERDFVASSVEFVVLGTAVRIPGWNRGENLIVTGLSGAEFWQLAAAGMVPLGLVSNSSVILAIPDAQSQWAMAQGVLSYAGRQNLDITSYSNGIEQAIADARTRLQGEAQKLGAAGIVGVRVDHHCETIRRSNQTAGFGNMGFGNRSAMFPGSGFQDTGFFREDRGDVQGGLNLPSGGGFQGGRNWAGGWSLPDEREDLIVTAHALGTAVTRTGTRNAGQQLQIMPVRNLQVESE